MPLDKIRKIRDGKIIGIWKITEDLSELLGRLNLSFEDNSLSRITSRNKMKEWCAVRITCMYLAGQLDFEYSGLRKDTFGKPYLEKNNVHLSVSHSYPFVAVIMDLHEDVGIDIEFQENRILRLAEKFMSIEEFNYSKGNLLLSTILWSAKEALYKLHGRKRLLFRSQLLVKPFDPETQFDFYGNIIDGTTERHELRYEPLDGENAIFVYTFTKTD